METASDRLKDAFVHRLREMGIEDSCMPRVLKDISLIVEANPFLECGELNSRLHLLGWSDIHLDYRLLELAKASIAEAATP